MFAFLNKKSLILIMTITILLLLACDKKKEIHTDYFSIVDSIKFENPHSFCQLKRIKDVFIGINRYKQRIELFNKAGKLLSRLGKYGNGPGEFINPKFLDIYNNYICIVDRGNNKITIVRINEIKDELNLISEFKINSPIVNAIILNNKNIIYSSYGDTANIKLCKFNGKIIKEYSTLDRKIINTRKDLLKSICYVNNIGNNFLFAYPVTMELKFYYLKNNMIFNKISTTKINSDLSSSIFKNNNIINITGIRGIYKTENEFFIFVSPKLTKKFLIEKYSTNGEFKGNYIVNNFDSITAATLDFSSNGDTLWFMDFENDTTIYTAKKSNIK